jgi:hypothetical protein
LDGGQSPAINVVGNGICMGAIMTFSREKGEGLETKILHSDLHLRVTHKFEIKLLKVFVFRIV